MAQGLAQPRTVSEMVQMARSFLERKGCEEARLEAELLVAHALETNRLGLFMDLERPVDAGEIDRARDLLVRRGRREPVAYITGEREFYGRAFRVTGEVLIPRPETELLVDRAREWARGWAAARGPVGGAGSAFEGLRVLDWGTGSGCLAITLALELPGSSVVAVDAFEPTLAIARENAERLGAAVEFVQADRLEALADSAGRAPFHLVLSNPPYVDPSQAPELAPEVRDYEPAAALFAPSGDPDHWVREILRALPRIAASTACCLVELGADQGTRALELGRASGLEARLRQDLAGLDRILEVLVGEEPVVPRPGSDPGSGAAADAEPTFEPPAGAE